ncbi:hypothetical protein BDZ89DRAFT_1145706 [Hymenopellis radicata]|nr:hypothetical protein BDZ89DRAFT_1145706 [Hymenopellis radicata]
MSAGAPLIDRADVSADYHLYSCALLVLDLLCAHAVIMPSSFFRSSTPRRPTPNRYLAPSTLPIAYTSCGGFIRRRLGVINNLPVASFTLSPPAPSDINRRRPPVEDGLTLISQYAAFPKAVMSAH